MANALVPFEQQQAIAAAIAKSGMFGIKTAEQALVLMALCEAENLHPVTAVRDFHIIAGRPALKADAMLARFQSAGGSVKWGAMTDEKVSAIFTHPQGGSVEIDWDMRRAKAAQLTGKEGSMWAKYPRQMLRARVISEGVRTCFPGATGGFYVPEEVQQFEPIRQENVINPVKNALGDWSVEHPEEMESLRELAAELVDLVETQNEPRIAYLKAEDQNLDSDQKLALWSILAPNSKTRSALKRERIKNMEAIEAETPVE